MGFKQFLVSKLSHIWRFFPTCTFIPSCTFIRYPRVPHLTALRYGKYETRDLRCGSTSRICQDVLKIDNLLHKQGLVETQLLRTVECFVSTKVVTTEFT